MLHALFALAYALLIACAVLGWLFVILYSRVRWYATAEGRHLMKFTTALALTFSLTLLFAVLDPKPEVRAVLSIGLFGWIAWELANRSRLHLKARREARNEANQVAAAVLAADRDTLRNNARDVLRDGPRDEARDLAHDEAQR